VDGMILFDIEEEDLIKDFKIDIRLHRTKLLDAIQKLKEVKILFTKAKTLNFRNAISLILLVQIAE
jgi:hypothetical protein